MLLKRPFDIDQLGLDPIRYVIKHRRIVDQKLEDFKERFNFFRRLFRRAANHLIELSADRAHCLPETSYLFISIFGCHRIARYLQRGSLHYPGVSETDAAGDANASQLLPLRHKLFTHA